MHQEAASDLSTSVFTAALKQSFGSRVHPSEIWSDNGTNFVGVDRWLQELQDKLRASKAEIYRYLADLGIKWVFNPPSAPHRGGTWNGSNNLRRAVDDFNTSGGVPQLQATFWTIKRS